MAVIERFEVVEAGGASLGVGLELLAVDELEFEGAPKALPGGVVVAVALTAHGGVEGGVLEGVAEVF